MRNHNPFHAGTWVVGIDERTLFLFWKNPMVLSCHRTNWVRQINFFNCFIRRIHKPERRIMTVEDPVEYEVAGINQTQVNSEIGFTFASALREILRQDPDVIMVGEIRDRETADIAIRASLTGHLVLSTLHTNDAPGAITRLIDMEIEPFLIASSVEMVIAQRLVADFAQECSKANNKIRKEIIASLALLRCRRIRNKHQR